MQDRFFKNKDGIVFEFSPLQIKQGLAQEFIALTEEEVEAFLNPVPTEEEILKQKLAEADTYLRSTDYYYARFSEIDEPVPQEVVDKRIEAREFIRANESKVK